MRLEKEQNLIRVQFEFDEGKVSLIKTVPGRTWDPENKSWYVPEASLPALARTFGMSEGAVYPCGPVNPSAFADLTVELHPDFLLCAGPDLQRKRLGKSLLDLCSYQENGEAHSLVNLSPGRADFPRGLWWRVKDFLNRYHFRSFAAEPFPQPPQPSLDIKFHLAPRDYQEEALKKLRSGEIPHRAALVLPTGAGKTALAALIAAELKVPAVFYVYSLDLLQQTWKSFQRALQTPIGVIAGHQFSPAPVTVAMVQTVISRAEDEKIKDFLSQTQLAFIDEGHMLGAETVYRISQLTGAYYTFALTATPFRQDGKDIFIEAGSGPTVIIKDDAAVVESGHILPVEIRVIKINHSVQTSNYYPAIYKKTVLSPRRNQMVAKICAQAEKPTLVLVKEIKHGEALSKLIKAPFIHGLTPVEEREAVLSDFRSGKSPVLIASGIFKQGIDIPEMRSLIMAHGGKSEVEILQKIGRARRPYPGKGKAVIYDFYDADSGVFQSHSEKRLRLYREKGFEIVCQLPPTEVGGM